MAIWPSSFFYLVKIYSLIFDDMIWHGPSLNSFTVSYCNNYPILCNKNFHFFFCFNISGIVPITWVRACLWHFAPCDAGMFQIFWSHGLQHVEDVPDLTECFRVCWWCFFFYFQRGFQLVGKEGVFISVQCLNRLFNIFNKQVKVFLSPSVPPLWIKDTRYKWSSAASDGCFAAGHLMCWSRVLFLALFFTIIFDEKDFKLI